MRYAIYLDDLRSPFYGLSPNGAEWVICRTPREFYNTIVEKDCMPCYISFDHDLGVSPATGLEHPSGYDVAKTLPKWVEAMPLPQDFAFNVHSANPVGARNIEYFMKNWLNFYWSELQLKKEEEMKKITQSNPTMVTSEVSVDFWNKIKEELIQIAHQSTDVGPFVKILEDKIETMGPVALSKLWSEIN